MISPFTSFIYFVGLTTVYFTLKYFLAEKHGAKNKGLGIALTVVYLIVMVLLQFGTNMKMQQKNVEALLKLFLHLTIR